MIVERKKKVYFGRYWEEKGSYFILRPAIGRQGKTQKESLEDKRQHCERPRELLGTAGQGGSARAGGCLKGNPR